MLKRKLILSTEAKSDLDNIEDFVSSLYRKESGIKFVDRLYLEIVPLSYSAGAFPKSCFSTAQKIHPEAKTLSIMKHCWTVVFHIDGDYVIVDRILPSSTMA